MDTVRVMTWRAGRQALPSGRVLEVGGRALEQQGVVGEGEGERRGRQQQQQEEQEGAGCGPLLVLLRGQGVGVRVAHRARACSTMCCSGAATGEHLR